jgi:uncharacterized protein YndB with AHSA1/START domain
VITVPSFELTAHSDAPVEEVWKLLHDPTRFPDWWVGIETVRTGTGGEYTIWPAGYPDFPMPQHLRTERGDRRVTISCLVSDLEYRWQLEETGDATDIQVHVDLPDSEADRLATQRDLLSQSISCLAILASSGR